VSSRLSGVVLMAAALASPTLSAQERGGLLGWVDDGRGEPVPGVVISLFGKGLGGSLVTLSDSAGRFFLPSLPPGSYTLRALGQGRDSVPPQRVTVLPNRDSVFTVSLGAGDEPRPTRSLKRVESVTEAESRLEELRWVLRHKRRSVLEAREATAEDESDGEPGKGRLLASILPDITGSLEVVADPGLGRSTEITGEGPLTGLSVVRLGGPIADRGRWSLAGLVSESESTAWRMAGEFVIEPMDGHELQLGTGYGTRLLRAAPRDPGLAGRGMGAVSLVDRWEIADGLVATVGGRFSYVGFLRDTNYLDPTAALEVKPDSNTRLRGSVTMRTLVPGGDLLTISSLASAPVNPARIDDSLQAERSMRVELAMDHTVGLTTLKAHTFYEGVGDQLLGTFGGQERSLELINGGSFSSRGMGLTVSRRFGQVLSGQVTYTYGHSWRESVVRGLVVSLASYRESDFHDVVARLETFVPETGTRVAALYRFNCLSPVGPGEEGSAIRSNRFDVQLNQGLPFLGGWTRADWDLLLAVRNVFYESSEGAALDEVAVAHPPTRVLGGVAVSF
jgi:hypothetical protein